MDNLGTVSVVIPVYNVAKYLPKCLDSVCNQTYPYLQIILVDDGSTDNSGKICDGYASKDSRITVVHQKNKGAAAAKNTGLDIVTGDYFTFIDSDDYVEDNWIEFLLISLIDNDADIAECAFDLLYVNGQGHVDKCFDFLGSHNCEEYLSYYISNWSCSIFWNKLFKSKLTSNIRFRNERRCIDDEFYTYKLISNADSIIRTNNVLYHYRQRKSSAVNSKEKSIQFTDDVIEYRIERFKWIKNTHPKLKKHYLVNDIDSLLYFSANESFDEKMIKKFRHISKYYFIQSLRFIFDMKQFYLALMLVLRTPKKSNTKNRNNPLCINNNFTLFD